MVTEHKLDLIFACEMFSLPIPLIAQYRSLALAQWSTAYTHTHTQQKTRFKFAIQMAHAHMKPYHIQRFMVNTLNLMSERTLFETLFSLPFIDYTLSPTTRHSFFCEVSGFRFYSVTTKDFWNGWKKITPQMTKKNGNLIFLYPYNNKGCKSLFFCRSAREIYIQILDLLGFCHK